MSTVGWGAGPAPLGGLQGYRATGGHLLTLIWERLQAPGCEDRPTTYKEHWK